jgi:hypothetical protein
MKLCQVCESLEKDKSPLTKVVTCQKCFLEIEQERFTLDATERRLAIPLPRDGECEFEQDCHRPIWARRFCRSHYERVAKLNVSRIRPRKLKPESDSNSFATETSDDLWTFVVTELKKKGHHSVRQL